MGQKSLCLLVRPVAVAWSLVTRGVVAVGGELFQEVIISYLSHSHALCAAMDAPFFPHWSNQVREPFNM
jgi:hypothetical protein